MSRAIQKILSAESPWEIFQNAARSSRVSFFLDSIHYRPPDQTYSYIGADPFLEVTLEKGRVRVRGEESGNYPAARVFDLLRRFFKKYKPRAHPGADFFTGGAVGFLGYELAALFEKIRFRPKPGPQVPLLYLGFYRDLIVYDHRRKVYHLAAGDKTGLKRLKSYFNHPRHPEAPFTLKKFRPEIPRSDFERMVRKAKAYIEAGDIYQANLSQRFALQFE